jgi:hypothetical protein
MICIPLSYSLPLIPADIQLFQCLAVLSFDVLWSPNILAAVRIQSALRRLIFHNYSPRSDWYWYATPHHWWFVSTYRRCCQPTGCSKWSSTVQRVARSAATYSSPPYLQIMVMAVRSENSVRTLFPLRPFLWFDPGSQLPAAPPWTYAAPRQPDFAPESDTLMQKCAKTLSHSHSTTIEGHWICTDSSRRLKRHPAVNHWNGGDRLPQNSIIPFYESRSHLAQ